MFNAHSRFGHFKFLCESYLFNDNKEYFFVLNQPDIKHTPCHIPFWFSMNNDHFPKI